MASDAPANVAPLTSTVAAAVTLAPTGTSSGIEKDPSAPDVADPPKVVVVITAPATALPSSVWTNPSTVVLTVSATTSIRLTPWR